jgi:radical SAM superfamily enzyme YgiQ (UPF0313 family)
MTKKAHNPQKAYFSEGRAENETGAFYKDWGGRYPVALIYPDKYEIGMSNLGIQAIYSLINNIPGYLCERVFWNDKNLLALESRRPMNDFACVGISFSYEMDYLNLPSILKEAQIPMFSKDRNESYPLIVAGGPCMISNPMPVAPFLDAICIGEAEAVFPDMLAVMNSDDDRDTILKKLSELDGVFVPKYPNKEHCRRKYLKNLDEFPTHSVVLTTDTALGDLYMVEVERGCSHNCRFCMVSHAFCPIRFRSLESLLDQCREGLKIKNRVGLVGPVVTDHPKIYELLNGILEMGGQFSISSLRLTSLTPEMLSLVCKGGAQSIAIAPEAGSDRLRKIIHKGFTEEDILKACHEIANFPFKQLKLYFMVGLPGETDQDMEEINILSRKCKEIVSGNGMRVNINVAPFVPKANTPFQWARMEDQAVIEERLKKLTGLLGGSGIDVKAESSDWSTIQGILSRGGTEISDVLIKCEKKSLAAWRRASKELEVKKSFDLDEELPWSIISDDRFTERLKKEYLKSLE